MAKKIDRLERFTTAKKEAKDMGQVVEEMVAMSRSARKGHEKRWYDSNFFDDGYHFRFLSRSTGRIVDLSQRASIYTPLRVIPKASKQIRGIVNLITQPDFIPVVTPDRIRQANYSEPQAYEAAKKEAKDQAKKRGYWLREEWDKQEIQDWKAPFMGLLTAKHGISYLQIWPDAIREKIRSQVYDAFDIYLMGSLTDLQDSPFVIKAVPRLISQIKADERFDPDQVRKIHPDNRYASSEMKEAYMSSKFGKEGRQDSAATLIQKEAFIKEYLNADNMAKIKKQEDGDKILQGREEGDQVVRQVFAASNIWLRDTYTDLADHPFVDLRFEPGPLYQTPLLERFKSANKSLDTVISRLERYVNTMTVGTWLKRQGEQFKINNIAGGQMIEYAGTPPIQGQMASIPGHFFGFVDFLNTVIEEQGVSTTAMGKIPKGVRAHAAIESMKASEFSAQTIAMKQMKRTMKAISMKMLEIADAYYVSPQEVSTTQRGEAVYFDVIGQQGIKGRQDLKIEIPEGVVPLNRDNKVEIEMQVGLGFTLEGKRAAMLKLGEYMRDLAKEGLLNPEAVKVVLQRLLETYEFGATAEFMEAMEEAGQQANLTEEQLNMIKVAMLETKKDLMKFESQQRRVDVAEVLKDVQKAAGGAQEQAPEASQEVQRTETVETGKDGRKTKREVKTIEKRGK